MINISSIYLAMASGWMGCVSDDCGEENIANCWGKCCSHCCSSDLLKSVVTKVEIVVVYVDV